MSGFRQFIQYRALAQKFSGHNTIGQLEGFIESGTISAVGDDGKPRKPTVEEVLPDLQLRNVCAKLPQAFVERLDNALRLLDMTKRDFIEMALEDALEQVDKIVEEVDVFEFERERRSLEETQ